MSPPTRPAAKNDLHLADDLHLDADYVAGASIALLGKRGAGKTYATRVLAEELHKAHVQTVILDPMGVFWGLRSSADGHREGLPIPVFGGAHGDAPLESTAGALMADLVVDDGLSMILDISEFNSRTQERAFAAAFFDRLYRRNRTLVHVIIDEADLFAPQRPRGQDAPLLATMENLVRRGRNRGIGVTMASQRAATLNKDVLTQVDALVAMRVTAPQDRDAIREWVRGQGTADDWEKIAPSLPALENGECWWWIPEKKILKQVQVRGTRTFDSSPTRTRGAASRVPTTLAAVDLDAISTRIAATVERAKATDPRELTKQVRDLEQALAAARRATVDAPAPAPAPLPAVVDELAQGRLDEARTALEEAVARLRSHETHLEQTITDLLEQGTRVRTDVEAAAEQVAGALVDVSGPRPGALGRPDSPSAAISPAPAPRPAPEPDHAPAEPSGDEKGLTPAHRRLLDALAVLEAVGLHNVPRAQLAFFAGVSPRSSGYGNNLGALRTAGHIAYPAGGYVALTETGRAHTSPTALDDLRTAPTLREQTPFLQQQIQKLTKPAHWRILEALITAHPHPIAREALAAEAGVSPKSSGYGNNLGALRTLGLIDYPEPGQIVASDVLFLP
ncbi:ATP-binding protein [Clavibacter sepedonicus]|uniref:ATP-binding protein n=1 Tax=Clavibacter sepedonicus TaxID=31964 RepID=UPI003DA69C1C